EELVRQRDDGLQPVVLNDPAPYLALTRSRPTGKQRRSVQDNRQPGAALLRRLPLRDHVLQEKERAIVDARPSGAEAPFVAQLLVLVADERLNLLPFHAVGRIGKEVV